MAVCVEKRTFTIAEYHKMSETGILLEDDRVELIKGEIVKMSPIGSRHAASVKRLNTLLNRLVDPSLIISVQDPICLSDDSEPEPDIALLKFRDDFYAESLPTADDVVLIIEVADTSVEYDRGVKLPLYAKAGIPEVWLADLQGDRIEVYAEPIHGTYQTFQRINRGESVTRERFPGLILNVEAILG